MDAAAGAGVIPDAAATDTNLLGDRSGGVGETSVVEEGKAPGSEGPQAAAAALSSDDGGQNAGGDGRVAEGGSMRDGINVFADQNELGEKEKEDGEAAVPETDGGNTDTANAQVCSSVRL